MAFAILRFEKLKTRGNIASSAGHMMRSRPTPNAREELRNKNRILVGSASPAQDVNDKLERVTKFRSNGVLAVEFLMTASPEWFSSSTPQQRRDWLKQSKAWLENTFGASNVAHLQLHLDERTPHLTGIIVPRKRGKNGEVTLSAAAWLDGRDKLSGLQDTYAEAVKDLGLERGARNSAAYHERPRDYIARVIAGADPVRPVLDKPGLADMFDAAGYLERQNQKLDEFAQAVGVAKSKGERTKRESERQKRVALASRKERDGLKAELRAERRAKADRMREIPLEEVSAALGLFTDPHDPSKLRDEIGEFSITITDQKFTSWKHGGGGGGAIDLVKHVLECDFNDALAWLSARYEPNEIVNSHLSEKRRELEKLERQTVEEVNKIKSLVAVKKLKEYSPPPRVDEHLATVRAWLCNVRRIPSHLVDRAIQIGVVYADKFRNAVFHTGTYCEKRGTGKTPFRGHAAGSDKTKAAWQFTPDQTTELDRLVVCEAPVDAMSYAALKGDRGTFAATGGVMPFLPENLASQKWKSLVIAYDNDEAGRPAAERLAEHCRKLGFKNVSVDHPQGFKDWNEALAAPPTSSFPSRTEEAPEGPSKGLLGPR